MGSLYTLIFILLAASDCEALFGIGRRQSVAVTGQLWCFGRPAQGVRVKLYDDEIMFDTKLDERTSDFNGVFLVAGTKREITNIDPKINVYHKCGHAGLCDKKFSIRIPAEYISRGPYPLITFDIGRINLGAKMPGESVDCIN